MADYQWTTELILRNWGLREIWEPESLQNSTWIETIEKIHVLFVLIILHVSNVEGFIDVCSNTVLMYVPISFKVAIVCSVLF